MGHDQENHQQSPGWIRQGTILAATALAIFTLLVFAQQATGHGSAGQVTAARPMGSGHAVSTGRSVGSRPMGPARTMGNPIRSGQRTGTVRANSFGASSAPPPSFELPKNVIRHWEIGPNVHIQPNPVQGNRIPHRRGRFGVGYRGGFGIGYVGLPYYADPLAFVDADNGDDTGDNAVQQAQPNVPGPQDYAPQAPYAEGPPEDGYGAPRAPYAEGPPEDGYGAPRAPYVPQGYPPPPQSADQNSAQSAAAQSDGLDHPAVTLIFNDGRQPVKVHSYVLTGSSVFVAENGHQRVIPVADLDLPATIAQNREAGVDFELPGGSR